MELVCVRRECRFSVKQQSEEERERKKRNLCRRILRLHGCAVIVSQAFLVASRISVPFFLGGLPSRLKKKHSLPAN